MSLLPPSLLWFKIHHHCLPLPLLPGPPFLPITVYIVHLSCTLCCSIIGHRASSSWWCWLTKNDIDDSVHRLKIDCVFGNPSFFYFDRSSTTNSPARSSLSLLVATAAQLAWWWMKPSHYLLLAETWTRYKVSGWVRREGRSRKDDDEEAEKRTNQSGDGRTNFKDKHN